MICFIVKSYCVSPVRNPHDSFAYIPSATQSNPVHCKKREDCVSLLICLRHEKGSGKRTGRLLVLKAFEP